MVPAGEVMCRRSTCDKTSGAGSAPVLRPWRMMREASLGGGTGDLFTAAGFCRHGALTSILTARLKIEYG